MLLIAAVGWQTSWQVAACGLLGIGLPVFLLVLREGRRPGARRHIEEPAVVNPPGMVHWRRGEVLRDPLYWLLVPCVLAPSFIVTALFFHQSHLAEEKGWSLAFWAATYPLYAVTSVGATVIAGLGVDRFSGRAMLPVVCLPLGVGLFVLAAGDAPANALVAMACIGLSAGSTNTIFGSLWPELYGTRHLGGIKAFATAAMVFSSALGPGVVGVLLDLGVGIDQQCVAMGVVCFLVGGLARLLRTRMNMTQPELYG